MKKKCMICGSTCGGKVYTIREMMYGTKDEFEYFQCAECECLQILKVPKNLNYYYPDNYYSFNNHKIKRQSRLSYLLKKQRTIFCLDRKGILGQLFLKLFGVPNLPFWVKEAHLQITAKILDVGCGSGRLPLRLRSRGFENVTGIDPLIDQDISYDNGVIIRKQEFSKVNEKYDCIMFHHSLEHIMDQKSIFKVLNRNLKEHGTVIIRIPVVSSFAWEKYRENWIQIDAPRHLCLHSYKSMEYLAKSQGFHINKIICDSKEFQFWGSEQYQNGIPLKSEGSYKICPETSIFTKRQIMEFREMAKHLNLEQKGDQACFVLRKQSSTDP